MRAGALQLLEFWFGPRPIGADAVRRQQPLWFGDPSAPELAARNDAQLRQRFGALGEAALAGQLDEWQASPRQRLALILLLDQLPRNVHRGTAQAFSGDGRALALAVSGMQIGMDATLEAAERWFFYMPLQHAESRDVQDESVAAFRRLAGEAPAELKPLLTGVVGYAQKHREIVQRFGRFPHRNALLGRESTAEELAWLAAGGERFGQ